MDSNANTIIYHKNVLEFATVANEYCKYLENIDQTEKEKFIKVTTKLLPLLYLKAAMIPEFETDDNNEIEQHVTETHYNFLLQTVAQKIDLHDNLVSVTDDITNQAEEVSISECFADIYQDLKNFTENFKTNTEDTMAETLWMCQYNFKHYWGARLIAILTIFHNLAYGDENISENNSLTHKKNTENTEDTEDTDWLENLNIN